MKTYWTIFEVGNYAHRMWQTTDAKKVVSRLKRGIQELKVVTPNGETAGRRFKEAGRWNWYFSEPQNGEKQ